MSFKFDPVEVVGRFKVAGAVLGVAGSMFSCGIVIGVLMTSYEDLRRELREQKDDVQRELDVVRAQYRSHSERMNSHHTDIKYIKRVMELEGDGRR